MIIDNKDLPLNKLSIAHVEINFLTRSVFFWGISLITTGLEFNLLTLLMENAGLIVTRKMIANKVFNRALDRCNQSINCHITNLRKKFELNSLKPVIRTVRGKGYIFLID